MNDAADGPKTAIDRWLAEQGAVLAKDLVRLLDVDAGLRDAVMPSRHTALVGDLRELLDIEAGLASIAPSQQAAGPLVSPAVTGHDVPGKVLPVYVVADESASMGPFIDQLNQDLVALHESLLNEPIAAATIRLSILGFSSDVEVRLPAADLREVTQMPRMIARGPTNFGAVFADLLQRIPSDVAALRASHFKVIRPIVIFITDGSPTDAEGNPATSWRAIHRELTQPGNKFRPNIIACGIGQADARILLQVATDPQVAFVSAPGQDAGAAIGTLFTSMTRSIAASGRRAELVFEQPAGFRMAIDVV